jgi:hypothetical protein
VSKLNILKTKYGNLKNPIVVGKYATGEIEELKFEEENSLKLNLSQIKAKFISIHLYTLNKPSEEGLFVNDDILNFVTILIEFKGNKVIIDKEHEYSISKNRFIIEYYGEKKLMLSGDL